MENYDFTEYRTEHYLHSILLMQAGSVLRGLGAAGRGDAGGGGGLPPQLPWSPGQLDPQLPARGQGQHHRHPHGQYRGQGVDENSQLIQISNIFSPPFLTSWKSHI